MLHPDSDLLTPTELKAKLKISPRTYSRLLAAGRLPFRLVGTVKRFVWADVLAALPVGEARRFVASRPPPPTDLVDLLKRRAQQWRRR